MTEPRQTNSPAQAPTPAPAQETPQQQDKKAEQQNPEKGPLNALLNGPGGLMNDWTQLIITWTKLAESVGNLFGKDLEKHVKDLNHKMSLSQLRAEMKDHLIPLKKEKIKSMISKKGELEKVASAKESQGSYMYRVLGIEEPTLKIKKDAKIPENYMIRALLIHLHISEGIFYREKEKAIISGISEKNPNTKTPDFYLYDPIFFVEGVSEKYEGGFIIGFDKTKNSIRIQTVENGKIIKKWIDAEHAFIAFHLPGNTEPIPEEKKSEEEAKPEGTGSADKDNNTPASTSPGTPAGPEKPKKTPPRPIGFDQNLDL